MKSFILLFIIACTFSCTQEKADIEPSPAEYRIASSELTKINPAIPNTVEFRLIDSKGNEIYKDKALCSLTYYIGGVEYKIPYLKPEYSSGRITFTRDQIINGAGLSDKIDPDLPLDHSPINFEMYVMNPDRLNEMEKVLKSEMEEIEKRLDKDIMETGLNSDDIPVIMDYMKTNKETLSSYLDVSGDPGSLIKKDYSDTVIQGVWKTREHAVYDVIIK